MLPVCAIVVAAGLAVAAPSPDWNKASVTAKANLSQPFRIDGIDAAIVRLTAVAQFPDGTPADTGAKLVEVEYWSHNSGTDAADFFERFSAYAELSDGTNTEGEGVSFYPLDSTSEIGALSLKPGDTLHARFYLEIPQASTITQLVIEGPVDGVKVALNLNLPPRATKH
ncbi:MAG: hypothetical protein M3Z37_03195 [Candidatus Eremiobacteraeota bacterium]|nr:hypothetical protein [Candidatus Eremiobacteraeota bacterium]